MSGGFAYVWQLDHSRINPELVDLLPVDDEHEPMVRELVTKHWEQTGSPVARRLLDEWQTMRDEFTAVVPRDYQRAVRVIRAAREAGREVDESVMAELASTEAGRANGKANGLQANGTTLPSQPAVAGAAALAGQV
jgi:glutamate synthase (NADPH/NADH) large chain